MRTYLDETSELRIVDIGSMDVNGSYRELLRNKKHNYVGIDMAPGHNVDVVLDDPYVLPYEDGAFDVVLCGQVFEHVEYFWRLWTELVRVLKPGGYIFLIAPSRGAEHKYPVDCWRFYPDGFRALAKLGGLELLEVSTDWPEQPRGIKIFNRLLSFEKPKKNDWGDCVGAFRK